MRERIVLAYGGGLPISAVISWLAEAYDAEIVTLTLDFGQGRDLEEIRDRALAAGAVRAHVLDVREEFARDFVLPALQAGALYEGRDPMAAALGRPLIAKKLLEIASIEQATATAHGCIGMDQKRMDASARALNPDIRVIAAARALAPPHSTHANLWGRAYTVTRPPAEAPDTPACVEISFERGVPAAINGVPMALAELIESLSIIAGRHGVGRIAEAERDVAGVRVRHVYEAPAAVVLHAAHSALETSLHPPELARLKLGRAAEYAHLVWNGLWFTPMREAMDAVNAVVQESVTGSVRITLFKGTLLTSEAAEHEHAAVPRA
ncbi:MAG: argininosuccinate synthase [Acidobacteria bacterium]|nr:argininosuccinate synthase [Acidobacteriota bacterium]